MMEIKIKIVRTEVKQIQYKVVLPKGTTSVEIFNAFYTQIDGGARLAKDALLIFQIGDEQNENTTII